MDNRNLNIDNNNNIYRFVACNFLLLSMILAYVNTPTAWLTNYVYLLSVVYFDFIDSLGMCLFRWGGRGQTKFTF